MSAQQTELKETNSTAVATAKPELPRDNQKKQGIGRIFSEHPVGARGAALLLLAVVIVAEASFYGVAWRGNRRTTHKSNGHIMPLSARINGYVLEVPVIEGQLVHAGDVLVTIDPKDYKIALEQARATFEDAQASAASSRFNIPITSVTTQSNVDSASTAVTNAEAGFKAAEPEFRVGESRFGTG